MGASEAKPTLSSARDWRPCPAQRSHLDAGRWIPVSQASTYPSYLKLHATGELTRRAHEAVAGLASCRACPRLCGVDRLRHGSYGAGPDPDGPDPDGPDPDGPNPEGAPPDGAGPGRSGAGRAGACHTGRLARVTSAFAHHGEESCISGERGSGTVFFSGCNLACVFCQNADISQCRSGEELEPAQLAAAMLNIQEAGCHNVNLVSPSHVVPQILEALVVAAADGLRLPIVYNSGGYDSLDSLRLLDGVVDIYMPDLKFLSDEVAEGYVRAPGYATAARAALVEMHRQVGDLTLDADGVARRGLLVRHLVMPGLLENTAAAMRFLASEVSRDTCVNVMAQYRPQWQVNAASHAEINRRPTPAEMAQAHEVAREAGLHRFA